VARVARQPQVGTAAAQLATAVAALPLAAAAPQLVAAVAAQAVEAQPAPDRAVALAVGPRPARVGVAV
jgi:hypothetical protein